MDYSELSIANYIIKRNKAIQMELEFLSLQVNLKILNHN